MNNDELKKILENNSKVPKAPSDEWSNILANIESEKKGSFNFFKFIGLTLATLAIVVTFSLQYEDTSSEVVEQNEIEAYLLDDSYYGEPDGFYAYFN